MSKLKVLRRMASNEEKAWVALLKSGVPAAEAREMAGLPAAPAMPAVGRRGPQGPVFCQPQWIGPHGAR